MNNRNQTIKEMRQRGMTYQAIGDVYRISRQRIHAIITGYVSPAGRGIDKKKKV
jgi:hypothetical protein